MDIKSAEFVISNTDWRKCPNSQLPEFAFVGRSNVGKSSLINMLTNRKGLAMTSSKPGKTLLINHFLINNKWFLVDLPGYGYVTQSKTIRQNLKEIIRNYMLYRQQMTNLFVLIDCRLAPQQIDIEFITWLGEKEIPFCIVFTKIDKLSKGKLTENIDFYKQKLLETWEELPPIFITSAQTAEGKTELLNYIEQILKLSVL
ncbi:MAG: ribosome biogenesis GTP-binding protein YihA/YsxC [Paludibacter sp.]|nr:ribosome biogenesis GTP-binding protein YihA/YsxC [Paludibacter sp.]